MNANDQICLGVYELPTKGFRKQLIEAFIQVLWIFNPIKLLHRNWS